MIFVVNFDDKTKFLRGNLRGLRGKEGVKGSPGGIHGNHSHDLQVSRKVSFVVPNGHHAIQMLLTILTNLSPFEMPHG